VAYFLDDPVSNSCL